MPADVTPELRAAAERLADLAFGHVMAPSTGKGRAADYLAALGAITGEAAIVAAGLDIETLPMPPGSPLLFDRTNGILTSDTTDRSKVGRDSVVGILIAELVPGVVPLAGFGSLEGRYRFVVEHLGGAAWGDVATTVAKAERHRVLPIREAFELRLAVDDAVASAALPPARRHVVCALAAAIGLRRAVAGGAIDGQVGLAVLLDVTFGMAKMAPMSKAAFAAASRPD